MNANPNDGIRLFVKAAIAASLAINSGALIAVLTRVTDLLEVIGQIALSIAIQCWTAGVVLSTLTWVIAAATASAHANSYRRTEIWLGVIGYLVVLVSIGSFALGMLTISQGLQAQ